MEFKVGDVVDWCGCRGVVTSESKHWDSRGDYYRMKVCFDDNSASYDIFYKDGKKHDWHKEPSLKLIKRLKRLYKVLYIEETGDCNDYTMTYGRYSSESEFKDKYPFDCKFIKLLEETMIEVEE